MKFTKLLPIAAGLLLAGSTQVASATTIVLPGLARPAALPALPDLKLAGGGSLTAPALPLPVSLPLPATGGALFVTGGVGGATHVVKPTTITVDGISLPALPIPALPGLPGM